jgi:carbon-monoxide dehydrogenase large subunit
MRANRYIGSPIERLEDPRFLRGTGTYVGDLSRPGLLYAAILRSAHAHGRIRSIDAAAALAVPGVHAVIRAADIGSPVPRIPIRLQPLPSLVPYHQPVIAEGKVRYVGEPIAVVLADSSAIAEDALDAVRVDIERLSPIVDWHAAATGESLLFEETGTNLAIKYIAAKGDPGSAWARADYVRRERFAVQRHTAVMMEPRGVLAEWDAARGRLPSLGQARWRSLTGAYLLYRWASPRMQSTWSRTMSVAALGYGASSTPRIF